MDDRATIGGLRAFGALAGGGVNNGSTCGIVSGGCAALALIDARAGRASGTRDRLREYTRWFESRFGSALCRERLGTDINSIRGMCAYVFKGRAATRCMAQAKPAVDFLVRASEVAPGESVAPGDMTSVAPGGGAPADRSTAECTGGLCAAPVFARGVETEERRRLIADVSIAYDGGVGLSGGMCGALAAALVHVGNCLGFDPREMGFAKVALANARGFRGALSGSAGGDQWSTGQRLIDGFLADFGAMECRSITGRTFESSADLESWFPGAARCAEIQEWCEKEVLALFR